MNAKADPAFVSGVLVVTPALKLPGFYLQWRKLLNARFRTGLGKTDLLFLRGSISLLKRPLPL